MDNLDGISCEWAVAARIIVSFGLLNGEEPFILAAEGQNERFLSGRICNFVTPACSRLLSRDRLLRQFRFRACDVTVWQG